LSPALVSYRKGVRYTFLANTRNTGAATLNLNGLGAKTIKKVVNGVTTDLVDFDIQAGQMIDVMYDGTNMQMLSQLGNPNIESLTLLVGADNGVVLVDADLGPQLNTYMFPRAVTIVEIAVMADAGTPSVIVHRRTGSTNTALVSSALATAASGGLACAKTTSIAGIGGATCAATLQNQSVPAGHTLGLTSGTAGGVAKRLSILVFYTVN
jgi:hypothetical protein